MTLLFYRPQNILNVCQISLNVNDDSSGAVLSPENDNKPIIEKNKVSFTLNILIF